MSNVIPISTHPKYKSSFTRLVERLMANPLFVRDVFGDGPEAA